MVRPVKAPAISHCTPLAAPPRAAAALPVALRLAAAALLVAVAAALLVVVAATLMIAVAGARLRGRAGALVAAAGAFVPLRRGLRGCGRRRRRRLSLGRRLRRARLTPRCRRL